MSTSLITIKDKVKDKVKFQETPIPLDDSDYLTFTIEGTQRLYTDAGWDTWDSEYDEAANSITKKLDLTEQEYILVASQVAFFNQIKNFWTTLCSYTTDAISVTGAKEIFKNIDGNVKDLESRLSQLAWKFTHRQV